MEYIKERVPSLYAAGGITELLAGAVRYVRYRYPKPEVLARSLVNATRYGRAAPDPFEPLWVDPAEIETYTTQFGTYQHLGAVRDGDWDRHTKPITDHPKYEAVERRFDHGERWEETGIYEHMLAEIEQKGELDGCRTKDDVEQRYEEIDCLYESITSRGYLPHEAVSDGDDFESRVDYVIVNIGRDGELIFNTTGWHRLAIAKILYLDAIPVLVGVRHAEWQARRESLASGASDRVAVTESDRLDVERENGGRTLQQLRRDRGTRDDRITDHPDLRTFTKVGFQGYTDE